MYDEAEKYASDYASSDDNLFSEATINNNKLYDIDEHGAKSPGSYVASEASIEAVYMESFLENSSVESTMSDNDDDKAVLKGNSISHHFMPSEMVYVSFFMLYHFLCRNCRSIESKF